MKFNSFISLQENGTFKGVYFSVLNGSFFFEQFASESECADLVKREFESRHNAELNECHFSFQDEKLVASGTCLLSQLHVDVFVDDALPLLMDCFHKRVFKTAT